MLTVGRRVSVLGLVVGLMAAVYLAQGSGARPTLIQEAGTPDAAATPEAAALVARGAEIYNSTCVACHQAEGAGVEGYYPALAGNPFVTLEDPTEPIRTVLQGRGGMPQFRTIYSDEEIAGVLTYVRQSWGNDAGPVSPEQVAAVRVEVVTVQTPEAGTPVAPEAGTPVAAEEPTPAADGTPADPSG